MTNAPSHHDRVPVSPQQLSMLLARPSLAEDVLIKGLTLDSRQVSDGYLFAALKGAASDGAQFIGQAVSSGAAAVLFDETRHDITVDGALSIAVANPRKVVSQIASRWFGAQPEFMVAVTGTNGKSSTVDLWAQLAHACGFASASLGTLGVQIAGQAPSGDVGAGLTTPDPIQFQETLASLAHQGITHAAFEASSHGLDQYRIDGAHIQSAGFANITRDHLDYHGTFENYLFAKLRLMGEILPPGGRAVINADAAFADRFVDIAWARGLPTCLVGYQGQDLRILLRQPVEGGQFITLEAGGKIYTLTLPLIGAFQVDNAIMAAGLLHGCGVPWGDILPQFETLQPVPGRLEQISKPDDALLVVVDYAHTPDALQAALKAMRPHTQGRIHVVFGCGGDRDSGKRPMMGEVAARLADGVIVTDDNPRFENPAAIRADVLKGCPDATEIGDRAEAIAHVISTARAGDTVLIAGKGHERGQSVCGQSIDFDDRLVASDCLETLKRGDAA